MINGAARRKMFPALYLMCLYWSKIMRNGGPKLIYCSLSIAREKSRFSAPLLAVI